MDAVTHLPLFGPTFGTYDELAVMASSGISPDSIPSGLSQASEMTSKYRRLESGIKEIINKVYFKKIRR